jgi:predicted site-specific integrase-resolvase
VREPAPTAITRPNVERVAVSARVAAAVNRAHLEGQADRLVAYGAAKGSQFYQGVKEVGAGVNDSRPQFLQVLAAPSSAVMVIEHQDRATRLGFRSLDTLLEQQGRRVAVVNLADNEPEELWPIWSPSSPPTARVSMGRAKRQTETIVRELTGQQALVAHEREQEVAEDAPR